MKSKLLLYTLIGLCIQTIWGQSPSNDDIEDAVEIMSLPFYVNNINVNNANTPFTGNMSGCNASSFDYVYYKISPQIDVDLRVDILNPIGDNFVFVYEASNFNALSDSELTFVSGQTCNFTASNVASLQANNNYYILIGNDSATSISFYDDNVDNNQIINFTDPNLKNALVNSNCVFDYTFEEDDFDNTIMFTTNQANYFNNSYNLDFNNDGEIQLSEALSVRNLNLVSNTISSLEGLEFFTNLNSLYIGENNVTDITPLNDLPLEILSCPDNPFTGLDVTLSEELKALYLGNPDLIGIDVSQNSNLLSLAIIDVSDSATQSNIDISANLNLLAFQLNNSLFESFDVSNNQNLSYLHLGDNEIINLDVSNNQNLNYLNLEDNEVINLDVSQNTLLKSLLLSRNNLSAIDLSQNTVLIYLQLIGNELTQIDVSQNPDLTYLSVQANNLTQLDITQNLLLNKLYCGYNELAQLDLSQHLELYEVWCNNNNLINLNLPNTTTQPSFLNFILVCDDNDITSLDLSQIPNLYALQCRNNDLNVIDVSLNPELFILRCGGNNFTSIDTSLNPDIYSFACNNSLLASIDLSSNVGMNNFTLEDNNFLETVNFQNGNNENVTYFSANGSTNLQTVCVDDVAYAITNFTYIEPQTIFVEDCNATTINYNLIDGLVIYDEESDGCDINDLGVPNVMVTTTDGINEFATFTQSDGSYLIDVVNTTYTTTVNLPVHFTTTPESAISTFSGFDETDSQDFCVTANQAFDDFEVSFIPLEEARPGFDTNYQLVYENRGVTTIPNGTISFQFNDSFQQFVFASPTEDGSTVNTLTFNYTNLLPFESRVIDIVLNTFQPPTVQSGDVLNFTATIESVISDDDLSNNTFVFSQEVVNSYDPNDIAVIQGESILLEQADKNLDYVIRFQNTGTASALNIVITHKLDSDLDFSSFRPISSSHDYRIQITNGDFVEFIFENINLPDIINDEPNSHGFIAFKIKPKPDAAIGDLFYGNANIYFDFNPPITTNTVSTEIVETLSISDFESKDWSIYPNPASSVLNIEINNTITHITIYDLNGRLLKSESPKTRTPNYQLDVNDMPKGIYFLVVQSENSKQTFKFIKK